MSEQELELGAEWTDDCGGKKDFDAPIISLSTRYWPRGGGFVVFGGGGRVWDDAARPEIKPSARASIVIDIAGDDCVEVVSFEVSRETEGEVRAAVEEWARGMYVRVVELVRVGLAGG